MNIGYDAKRLFYNDSGLGNYSRTLVSDMRRLYPADEITLFSPGIRKVDRTKPFIGADYALVTPQRTPKALRSWWRSVKLSAIAKKTGIDVYHGLSNELPSGMVASGVPSVVTMHDLIFLRFPEFYPRIDRHFYKRKSKRACEDADAIVAISQRTADDLVELLSADPSKITVIHQGCDTAFSEVVAHERIDKEKAANGIERDYIVCIGTVEERKNQHLLVEAFSATKAKKDLDLVIIGRHTKYAERVKADVARYGLKQQVHLLQGLDFHAMLALLKGARMSVYPSKYEGFGLPILEAMTAGVPVIAGSGSCLGEVGGETVRYADPYQIEHWRDIIDELYDAPTELEKMREAGRARAATFSNETAASKYHKLYESILG